MTRFDDLLFRAVIATGAATLVLSITLTGGFAVVLMFLAGALSGAVTVIVAAAVTLAVLVRRHGKEYDREQVALAEANSLHGRW